MKKFFKLAMICCLLLCLFLPGAAFAETESNEEWQDISLSEEEFNGILSLNPYNAISTYSSDLIKDYGIAISKSNGKLVIAGYTYGTSEVTKCGFKKVTVQRRAGSSDSWETYKTYEDLYNESFRYTLSKTLSVSSGYQYRVTCTHYAKKSLLSTQKISNTSNTVTF